MRRALTLAATAGLAAATFGAGLVGPPAQAAPPGYTDAYRAHTGAYTQAGGVSTGTAAVQTTPEPALTSKARTGEDSVTVAAKDNNGATVAMKVLVTTGATSTQVLGCSKVAVKVKAGSTVAVTPLTGRCADGRVSTPSAGKITLTYHRLVAKRSASSTRSTASPAQRWAVLIGVQDYAGSTASTVGARGDVDAIRRALIGSGWRSENIKVVLDSQATQSGIRSAMAWLAARSTPQTFSFLHFSGHVCIASRGPCPSGHTYLWSYDNRFIPETEVVSRMRSVKGYQWMDIAGCQGGAFNAGYASSSRMFTGSSRSNETSYEERAWKQSVWTGIAWERGYNQGLAHPSGNIRQATMHQIANYGVRQVPSYTSKQRAGVQHPVVAGGSSSWKLSAPPGG